MRNKQYQDVSRVSSSLQRVSRPVLHVSTSPRLGILQLESGLDAVRRNGRMTEVRTRVTDSRSMTLVMTMRSLRLASGRPLGVEQELGGARAVDVWRGDGQ